MNTQSTSLNARLNRRGHGAFTLIEILVVIAIIGILASLLLVALPGVFQKAKRTQARVEVNQMAGAWDKYFMEYSRWPSATVTGESDPETNPLEIRGNTWRILRGDSVAPDGNLKHIPFMTFSTNSMDSSGSPLSPYKTSFFVKFDWTFDNIINAGAGEPDDPPAASLHAKVIVWTVTDDGKVIGSWQ